MINMVCPKCGMHFSGSPSECKHCGAPIPAELGGDRPDPIYDEAYDWLRADELQRTAALNAEKPKLAPRREERERLRRNKAQHLESVKTRLMRLLPIILAAAVLAVLALLYLSRG